MPSIVDQRDAAIKSAKSIVEAAKSANREVNQEEFARINGFLDQVKELSGKIANAKANEDLMARLGELDGGKHDNSPDFTIARSLGDHFVKHGAARLASVKSQPGASVQVPEFKAASDVQVTGGLVFPQIDTTVVQGYRRPIVVADLCSSGSLSSQSITYFVEGAREGDFATVPEGGLKPQLHYNFTTVTESLTKIAGFIKLSDEMIEDLSYLVTEINTRLLYDLQVFEENQILNGNGTAPNLRGILQRSGIQTETGAALADNLDAIFRAMTKVQTVTGYSADGLVINPADYQVFRLSKDGNEQYYGGGPFTGAYGNSGGVPIQPALWGTNTVVTSAIAAGTVLVGAFKQAATVYRKGGVTVTSTNSNVDDFEHNLVTIRAEERLALAVRVPPAFVKVTLGTT